MPDSEITFSEIPSNPTKIIPSPKQFEILPGGHVKKRPHSHGKTPLEDKAYFKGSKEREGVDRRMVRQQIDEALRDFESGEEARDTYSPQFFEDWENDEIIRAENRLEELGIDSISILIYTVDTSDTSVTEVEDTKTREEKVEQFELRKERIVRKQRCISQLMETIATVIYEVPDITPNEIMELVEDYREKAELTPHEVGIFRSIAESYKRKHDTVVDYYESLSSEDIYEACFGNRPSGPVDCESGPMTLNLRCYDLQDYAHAFFYNSQKVNQLTESNIKRASSSDGVAFRNVADPRLHGVVIMENATRGLLPYARRLEIRDHEEQHQINKLFSPMEQKMSDDFVYGVLGDPRRTPKEALASVIRNEVRLQRQIIGIDARARDEMIAYYAHGSSIDHAHNTLMKGSLYNYPAQYRSEIQMIWKKIQDNLALYFSINKQEGDTVAPIIHKNLSPAMIRPSTLIPYIEEIISRKPGGDYDETLKRWVKAVKMLEQKGYKRHEILSIMYSNGSSHWRSIARSLPPKFARVPHQKENS